MSNHFHEHYDAIVVWSWKLFCAMWARMITQATEREAKERERKEAEERERAMDAVVNANHQRLGM